MPIADRRSIALVAAVFAMAHIAVLVVLGVVAAARGLELPGLLEIFDGAFYGRIVENGYPASVPVVAGTAQQSELAFFPGFPLVVAPLVAVGVPFAVAATGVNLIAGTGAVVFAFLITRRYAEPSEARLLTVLWSVLPLSFVLVLTYSEALYCLWAFGCLLAVLDRRWLLAGAAGALATLTRPTGVVVVLALAVAVAVAARRGEGGARSWVAIPMAASGFAGYMAFLWARTGQWDAWFVTEREGWGARTDGGLETARRSLHYLANPLERPAATAVAVYVLVVVALMLLLVWRRPPLPVLVFAVATALLPLSTSNTFSSVPRHTLPGMLGLLFPLVVAAHAFLPARIRAVVTWLAVFGLAAVMVAGSVVLTTMSTFPP